jgi:hypothetical protein
MSCICCSTYWNIGSLVSVSLRCFVTGNMSSQLPLQPTHLPPLGHGICGVQKAVNFWMEFYWKEKIAIPYQGINPALYSKVKVKCTLVQALRLCTGRTAHRGGGGRDIALLFHDNDTRRGWGVSVTLGPLFTPGKDPVQIVQEAGWAPGSA